ncbi:MAG: ATP-binding cassette domain-containing protein [Lachnospiraceae bacterium]|nr:ATP-binding cassette domain-containing protein [Lachnospiraceae bacterium]
MSEEILISARNITKSYSLGRKKRHIAVNDVSLELYKGETLALVGESGCGKSTLARLLMRLIKADSGRICFEGTDISALSGRALKPYRKRMQMIFQDPASSLDPRLRIRDIIAEPLRVWRVCPDKTEMERRILDLLDMVELKESMIDWYPRELSGGQKQRVGIARAIALDPELIICDESVSALDVSVQAQILNLLKRLKKELGLSCLFISHDLSVVNFIADRVCVMRGGVICETADTETLYAHPGHEYTRYLLSSIPAIGDDPVS